MIADELPDAIAVYEGGILPAVPDGLPWAPGWCYRCRLVRDVAPAGTLLTEQGVELPLRLCHWHWAEMERDMIAVAAHYHFPALRAHFERFSRWPGTLSRARVGTP